MGGSEQPSPTEKILDEHHHLRARLEEAQQVVAARQAGRQTVVEVIDALEREVLEHFQHEERGGYFSDAIAAAPRLSAKAKKLFQEHAVLATQLDELRRSLAAREPDAAWWDDIANRFARFADLFRRHEFAENALLQDAYIEDIGSSD